MTGDRSTRAFLVAGILLAATVGLVVAGGHGALGDLNLPFRILADLPIAALLVGTAAVAALPLLLRRWQWALGSLLVWLVVEDLVRKLAGNELLVYLVKDLLLLIAVVAVAASPRARGLWRSTTGWTRWALYALGTWALVMAVPSALVDVRVPLVGLRLNFLYVPLVVAGALIASERSSLRRWLLGLSGLGAISSALGLVQAAVGPAFLAPPVPVRGLKNLVLIRGNEVSGSLYRPTGTFVDPGRFASMALVALAVSLAALLVTRGRRRWVAAVCVGVNGAAVLATGQRSAFVLAVALTGLAALARRWGGTRHLLHDAAVVAAAVLLGLAALGTLLPGAFSNRAAWYRTTLDPRLDTNEWSFRWRSYSTATVGGLRAGGLFGRGTGTESLGLQYLYPGTPPDEAGYRVEGGYASVAVEWGVVGLALWLLWSLAWVGRQWTRIRRVRGDPVAAAGLLLLGWVVGLLFLQFAIGLQSFQNYLANAYFWLLSGVVLSLPRIPHRGGVDRE